ncbi:MutS-related protein [Staphylococcus epidermidis]|uniref:MutS-related protein n=1 Tax=Staphylococcus epidermidis TaxID=1282 RepID=UPI000BACE5A7|nr:DNA mismatch repair protein MutS [Staphylococcus epidermidis]MCD4859945.1 hypothetical protein [Campylobacter coli]MBM0756306.1 MutS family DNA mismatch repair protein [Staphylococcus epidermidis]MBM0817289.1 MutS family DNA mismatch repair protein [Staphylococcus epidermidis]MBM5939353.1 MutS family DNA mismatch repair protein [Staphylococcus epidermidis]MBM5952880.1 MutS family DNA mismatch repair protein [Staphylococcus epidermidis]
MNSYQIYIGLGLVLGIVLLTIVTSMISSMLKKKQLISNINNLWKNKRTLENFIRPNSRFDYQFKLRRNNNCKFLVDDKTWSDLNFGTLFHQSNFNFTAIGEMRWYATLRNMFHIEHRNLLNLFTNDERFRKEVSYHLALIGKVVYPIFPDQIKPANKNTLFMLCPFLPLLSIIIILINPAIGVFTLFFSVLLNFILSSVLKRNYNQDLKSLFYTAKVLKQSYLLNRLENTPKTNVNFRHFNIVRLLSGFLGKADEQNIGGAFIMFFKKVFMLDYFFFHKIQSTYSKYQEELLTCYDYISTLDNHYSLAMYRQTLDNYCEPTITVEKKGIDFDNLVHPLLENAVPNSLSVNNNILLTGSNASGKSTFMKAIASNLILAQTINTVTADAFIYHPGEVYTSMANKDDVLSGDSYFMAELKSIHRLLNTKSESTVYCFIDEIFKGTNTTERIAASESVLNYLNTCENYRVIAATHDIELAKYLKDTYKNYHFNESIEKNHIYFDYKIKEGKANTRNAIELLRISQFPLNIYQRAMYNVKNFS